MSKEDRYFELEPGRVILEGTPGKWDANGVHTLSIVEVDREGWKYWGYYCGGKSWYSFGTGLARSNDLLNWTKYSLDKPLVGTDAAGYGGRWPSVVRAGELFYMFVTKDYTSDSHIALYTSQDGKNFDFIKEVVLPEAGLRNQNPNPFYDLERRQWILYYYHGNDRDLYQIRARVSDDLMAFDQADDTIVLERGEILASPSMFSWDGKYYLLTETALEDLDDWRTRAWVSNDPLRGFMEMKDSPLPGYIHACAFQHNLNGRLVVTYSYQRAAQPEWEWDVRLSQAPVE